MTTANSERQFLLSICKDSKNAKFAGFFVMSLAMMQVLYVLEMVTHSWVSPQWVATGLV